MVDALWQILVAEFAPAHASDVPATGPGFFGLWVSVVFVLGPGDT